MNYIEAIAILNGFYLRSNADKYDLEALDIGIEAIEKQIPKKPLDDFSTHAIYDNDGNYLDQIDTMTFKCPICNHILARGEIETTDCAEIHYCDNCGQALDWNS